ncbi:MAG: T9SS type A sorting domain-containing protein [Bacteroidales bacterium]|jgi:hypothetical protein
MKKNLLKATGMLLLMLVAGSTWGQVKTWTGGAGDGLWTSANNWNENSLPTSANDVVLDNTTIVGSYTVTIDGVNVQTVKSLQIGYAGNSNTITVVVSGTTNSVLTVKDGGATALHIMDGGVLSNQSTNGTRGIKLNNNSDPYDVFKMSGSGRYIHVTTTSGSGIPETTSSAGPYNYNFASSSFFENQSGSSASFDPNPIYGNYIYNNAGGNSAAKDLIIGGNLIISQGELGVCASTTNQFSIDGNIEISNEASFRGCSSTGVATINLLGSIIGQGTLKGNTNVSGTTNLNVGGNISTLISSMNTGQLNLVFTGGNSTVSFTPINSNQNIRGFTVASNKTVTLGNSMTIPESFILMINSDGALVINTDLTVSGTLTNNAGTSGLVIESDVNGTGSLIGGGGTSATVKRYLTNYTDADDNKYHFISSPVAAQAIQPEFVEDPPLAAVDFYKYDEPSNTWINTKLAETGAWNTGFGDYFEVGKGYLVAYPTTPVTKSFTGTLNSYTTEFPLVINCTNNADNGWNLIGNPFSSAIDWDLVQADLGNGMDHALYYYDASQANYRYYIQLAGETGALGSGSQSIPVGQGFMVHAKTSGTQTVTLNNTHQIHSSQSFYKNINSLANLLVLKVVNEEKEDETTLFFYPEATNGFDGSFDAYKLYSYAEDMPQIYSIINGNTRLAINSMHSIEGNPIVQLGFKSLKDGEFTIQASGVENFDNSVEVVLKDGYSNKKHNFNIDGDYTFTTVIGDFADRFEIHFSPVGIEEPSEPNQINAYVYNNNLHVQSNLSEAQISLYDIRGRQMYTEHLNNAGLHKTELNLPTGIYIVRLQSNNQVKNVKVFIN